MTRDQAVSAVIALIAAFVFMCVALAWCLVLVRRLRNQNREMVELDKRDDHEDWT